MSWFLAFLGFALLIILHEAGHFTAAKAVGMRVERFSLFFPPLLVRKKIGETEYAIGAIPAGGYVKISGMNPSEQLPEEVRDRAYHAQPVWKRVVVIAAGPAVNLVLAFVLFVVFFWLIGVRDTTREVGGVTPGFPAVGVIHKGDRLIAVDGHRGSPAHLSDLLNANKCRARPLRDGCRAPRPSTLTLDRGGKLVTVRLVPVYDASAGDHGRMRVGFTYGESHQPVGFGKAIDRSASAFWDVSKKTIALPARIVNPQQRKQLHGIVGSYETTRQSIIQDPGDTVGILALISLSLAIVNLFPFLPLDGGRIFWAIVEKLRRRPVPLATMERSGFVGFALVLMLFVIGLTNDINQLSNGGFGVR